MSTRAPSKPLTDEQLLWYDPFAGDKDGPDGPEFSNVVRTRRAQQCNAGLQLHPIAVGARAVVYRWRAGGEWSRMYVCADCIERWQRGDW